MYANYHTHTTRCNHAIGTEEEYIKKAIDSGMQILGFSDHVPYPFPKWHNSNFRMRIDELPDYVNTLKALREKYKDDIQILIGFETEYYPAYFNQLIEILDGYDYDYLILGQHFLESETSGIYSGNKTNDEAVLEGYVNQTIEAMETGRFSYLVHPDIINYIGSDEIYSKHMKRLCVAAKRLNIPLEINFLGMKEGRNYPCDKFFKIVGEVGNQVVFGSDAHNPEDVYNEEVYNKCVKFADKFGITPIKYLG